MKPHIIIDLEATCWEKDTLPTRMETIEIGMMKTVHKQEKTPQRLYS